jgi:hypothetical protein
VVTAAQIQAAMDTVPRPMPYTPWWAISTLRPTRPPEIKGYLASGQITSEKQSQQPSAPVSRDIVPDPIPEYPQAISEPHRATERLGVTMQLDIAMERRRSFWWRLKSKLQIFRS